MGEKVVRVGGRGTSRRVVKKDDKDGNWTGAAFKNVQKDRKEKASERYISTGRGTGKIKFGDIAPSSGRPSGKGMWVRTGRGTGKRYIEK